MFNDNLYKTLSPEHRTDLSREARCASAADRGTCYVLCQLIYNRISPRPTHPTHFPILSATGQRLRPISGLARASSGFIAFIDDVIPSTPPPAAWKRSASRGTPTTNRASRMPVTWYVGRRACKGSDADARHMGLRLPGATWLRSRSTSWVPRKAADAHAYAHNELAHTRTHLRTCTCTPAAASRWRCARRTRRRRRRRSLSRRRRVPTPPVGRQGSDAACACQRRRHLARTAATRRQ